MSITSFSVKVLSCASVLALAACGGSTTTTGNGTTGSTGTSSSVSSSGGSTGATGGTTAVNCTANPSQLGCSGGTSTGGGTTTGPVPTTRATGDVEGFSYNATRDELTIPLSVPFDAGGTYVRAPSYDVGGFKAYRSQGSLRDFVAVHDVSPSGESQVVSVGSTSYASTGFRGTSVTTTSGSAIPTSGFARYTGEYASVLVSDGYPLLYVMRGDVTFDVDFTDATIGGNVVGRRINYDPALAPFVQFPFEFQDAGGNTVSNLADLTAISNAATPPPADPADNPFTNGSITNLEDYVDALVNIANTAAIAAGGTGIALNDPLLTTSFNTLDDVAEYLIDNPTNPASIPELTKVFDDLVFPTLILSDTKNGLTGNTFAGGAGSTQDLQVFENGEYSGAIGGANNTEAVGSVTVTSTQVLTEGVESEENGVFIATGGTLQPDNTNP